ncbi:MAG: sterol desaturase family protein [Flavobacteriales bacterium]|nr:sterol desaturase family protein [Flavobacteriales bacterium]
MEYIALAIPVFVVLMALEFWWAWHRGMRVYRLADMLTNIGCGVGQQVIGLFLSVGTVAAYGYVYDHWRLFTLPTTWWMWIALFLGVDFCYYWFHRLSHEINFLWAAHVVHHQSEDYNLSVALRQSWFQQFFSWLFYVPLAWIGFHPVHLLTVAAFNTLYQFWIHTELIGRLGPLEWILNTPSHHRVHHGRNPQYIDRNHGGTLIIWDRIFGTFEPEKAPVVYGITTPLRSFNPFTANFQYWRYLVRLASQTRLFWDRLKTWWAMPGWKPDYLGGPEKPPIVSRNSVEKFEVSLPLPLSRWIFFQFCLSVLSTSAFLYLGPALIKKFPDWCWLLGWAILLLAHLGCFGTILHEPVRVNRLESIRLMGSMVFSLSWIFWGPAHPPLPGVMGASVLAWGLSWIYWINEEKMDPINFLYEKKT